MDVVFANAGQLGTLVPLAQIDLAEFDKLVDVNVKGTLRTLIHAAKHFGPSGGTFIVNSSWLSSMNFPTIGAYAMTKAALDSLVRTAAAELADKGVKVYSIK